ncbi:MAG: Glutathionyl-hydroquinone reductase YqjG [Deltaproteobacteria bacterium]|jgi:putative glutathione S-transferase|nr:Glutathionyl-hydroquinone reductase YqjG [Deltaproteobacteria bacterium]
MGLLIEGKWHDHWYDTKESNGEFVRQESQFRSWITPDGSAGPSGTGDFPAETGRYHLYVSLACPWAHRALIFRKLKALQKIITVSTVHPHMLDQGWVFDDWNGETGDNLYGYKCLHQLYTRAKSDYSGRVTVPVLWDSQRETIVSNESSEIIRMFNSAFNDFTPEKTDYYPEALREGIDTINADIYQNLNNGVYRCGFATTQKAYKAAFSSLFKCLDQLETRLANQRFLLGEMITEADWRLFTTLVRFDAVYFSHFKTNLRRIRDYPALSGYLRDLYQQPGIAETVSMEHIKQHYYYSHHTINPTRIVPEGPELNFSESHQRDRLFAPEAESK